MSYALEIAASVTDTWANDYMANNAYNGVPLLQFFEMNNAIEKRGGDDIRVGLQDVKNDKADDDYVAGTTAKWTRPSREFTSATWPFAYANVPIEWDADELDAVTGPEQMIDLVSQRFGSAENSMRTTLETLLLANGGTNKMDGILKLIGNAKNTVGGIDATGNNNTWWRPTITTYSGKTLATYSPTFEEVNAGLLAVSFGNSAWATAGLTRTKLYNKLIGVAQGNERFVKTSTDPNKANIGFRAVNVSGVDIFYPDEATATTAGISADDIYLINSNYTKFVKRANAWMTRADVQRLDSEWVYETAIRAGGNLICEGRRYNGVIRFTT